MLRRSPGDAAKPFGISSCLEASSSDPRFRAASTKGITYGEFLGPYISTADADKAYCQAPWDGTPFWVEFLKSEWLAGWAEKVQG